MATIVRFFQVVSILANQSRIFINNLVKIKLMMHLARFDERYRNGGDRLTEKDRLFSKKIM
ncbi:hypothetical protein H6H01_33160 [Nostoc calcicola FACHB-3891]|nr:hypothetical protein [Nostoc calcicola FACHB-3891]